MSVQPSKYRVLTPEKHDRLIADMDRIALTAGIPVFMLDVPASDFCNPSEIEYLRHLKSQAKNGVAGLCIMGVTKDGDKKIMAMTATLLRNYIDARVISAMKCVELIEARGMPNPTVLLIPNLCVSTEGKPLTGWQINLLLDTLGRRFVEGKQTIVQVPSLATVAKQYGQQFSDYLESHFTCL